MKDEQKLFWAELGLRVAIAREAKGFTQATLGRRVNLARTIPSVLLIFGTSVVSPDREVEK